MAPVSPVEVVRVGHLDLHRELMSPHGSDHLAQGALHGDTLFDGRQQGFQTSTRDDPDPARHPVRIVGTCTLIISCDTVSHDCAMSDVGNATACAERSPDGALNERGPQMRPGSSRVRKTPRAPGGRLSRAGPPSPQRAQRTRSRRPSTPTGAPARERQRSTPHTPTLEAASPPPPQSAWHEGGTACGGAAPPSGRSGTPTATAAATRG